jgi:ABC-type antimicrobial peptide transport system permease subunit
VSPDFFRTMQIPLKSGRTFESRDTALKSTSTNYGAAATAPVVVNEAFVRKLFPNEDPLGRDIVFGPDHNSATWTIIGVVGNVRGSSLGANAPEMVYRSMDDGSRLFRAAFVVRTHGDPRSVIRAVEDQVHAVDRDLPIFDVKTMGERRAAALAPEQFQLAVIGGFSIIAILLAAAGVYGVVLYLVTRRTREIGIRMAVGARPFDVLRMVINEAMVLVITGAVLGLAAAAALGRYVQSVIHGVEGLNTPIFAIAAILLAVVVLIAAWTPARYASRIDPMRALRED